MLIEYSMMWKIHGTVVEIVTVSVEDDDCMFIEIFTGADILNIDND
jgi:hypothetical protein